jgi:glutamine amidotransferase
MIAILNACGSNLASVQFAIERLGKHAVLTADPKLLQSATHVILPGVGTAKHAMDKLHALGLIDVIRQLTQPVLGICLGMQILFDHSSEGDAECLQLIAGKVTALPEKKDFTLPHMGWNQLEIHQRNSPLFNGIEDNSHVYYVHGYAAPVGEKTLATTHYSNAFSAMVQHENFYGMQFHPERSGKVGARLLENFFELS